MSMPIKLTVSLWEREQGDTLSQSYTRKLAFIARSDQSILSLKHSLEQHVWKALKVRLHVREFIDGLGANISWDGDDVVGDHFTHPRDAQGFESLFTLKVVRTVDNEELDRRLREGTVSGGGSIDFRAADSSALVPLDRRISSGNHLEGAYGQDQVLPSTERDLNNATIVPDTPVSRKRRRSQDHNFRPNPASRAPSNSLQITHVQPRIDRRSPSLKSEPQSDYGGHEDPELPPVIQVQNSLSTTNGDVPKEETPKAGAVARTPASRSRTTNGFTTLDRPRGASKEALRRTSLSVSPREVVWEPESQEPGKTPKRPTALSRVGSQTKRGATTRLADGKKNMLNSRTPTSTALTLAEDAQSVESTVPETTSEQSSLPKLDASNAIFARGTATTTTDLDENLGDLITGNVTPEDEEDAMAIDVPEITTIAPQKAAIKSPAAARTATVPASQRQTARRSFLGFPESSPRPILRKPSITSEGGLSTRSISHSSPSLSRRSVEFSAEPPAVFGQTRSIKATKTARKTTRQHSSSESDSSDSEESEALPEREGQKAALPDGDDAKTPKAVPGEKTPKSARTATFKAGATNMLPVSSSEANTNQITVNKAARGAKSKATTAVVSAQPKTSLERSTPAKRKQASRASAEESTPAKLATPPVAGDSWAAWRMKNLGIPMPAEATPKPPAKKIKANANAEAEEEITTTSLKKRPAKRKTQGDDSKAFTPEEAVEPVETKLIATKNATAAKTPRGKKSLQSPGKASALAEKTADESEPQPTEASNERDASEEENGPGPDAQIEKDASTPPKEAKPKQTIDMLIEMRERASSALASSNRASPVNRPPAEPIKRARVPPGSRPKNAPVVARPSSRDKSTPKKAASPPKTDTEKVDGTDKKPSPEIRESSDKAKIDALEKSGSTQNQPQEISSTDESSDESSDAESVIPGVRPDPPQPQATVRQESAEEDAAASASESDDSDDDADAMLTKALPSLISSQSISLTPPVRGASKAQAEPVATETAKSPDAKLNMHTSQEKTPRPQRRTWQSKPPPPIDDEDSSSDEALPLPPPKVPFSQPKPFKPIRPTVSDDSESSTEYTIPKKVITPNDKKTFSQATTQPPSSAQSRVTSQLNAENAANLPNTQEPTSSSQFGQVDTPTLKSAPARGSKLYSIGGLSRPSSSARPTPSKSVSLSNLIQSRKRGNHETSPMSASKAPSIPAARQLFDLKAAGGDGSDDEEEEEEDEEQDDDDDEENKSDNSDEDSDEDEATKLRSKKKKSARSHQGWMQMVNSMPLFNSPRY